MEIKRCSKIQEEDNARKPTPKSRGDQEAENRKNAQFHTDNRTQMRGTCPKSGSSRQLYTKSGGAGQRGPRRAPVVGKEGYYPYIHISAKRVRIPCYGYRSKVDNRTPIYREGATSYESSYPTTRTANGTRKDTNYL